MPILRGLFWASLLLVVYTYLIYPILLFIVSALIQITRDLAHLLDGQDRRVRDLASDVLPRVSLIIPAFNEEMHLPSKLQNTREIDYPRDRLQVILVSDGSTDDTNEILRSIEDPGWQAIVLSENGGKAQAVNHGVAQAKSEVLVLSDASTLFAPTAIRKLVRHFEDARVGVACGVLQFESGDESKRTEGLYWRYERTLRSMEGRLGATLTASGAIYAVRKACYQELAPSVILDDFVVPMNARALGFGVAYDPEAQATDFAAASVAAEYQRRVRIAQGSYRALPQFLKVPLGPATLWAFVSHKLLRWLLPFAMLALLVTSGLLSSEPLYRAAFGAQAAFYLAAWLGHVSCGRVRLRGALLPYYLTMIHLAFLVGFFRHLKGGGDGAWSTEHK